MTRTTYEQLINFLSSLNYAILLFLLLLYLPLTAFSWAPGHGLLGGMFIDLAGWHMFFAALCFFAVAWSLMLATGLLVDCIEHREREGYLSQRVQDFLSVPVTRGQFVMFTLLGAYSAAIAVIHASERLRAAAWAIGGAVACFLIMLVLCAPARLADPGYMPLPRSRIGVWLCRLLDRTVLPRLFRWLRTLVSRILHVLHIRYALDYVEEGGVKLPRLKSDRFFALTNFLGLVAVVFALGLYYFPPHARACFPGAGYECFPPAAAFLYVLLALALWILLSLDCHLAKIRVSPLLVIVLVMLLVWGLGRTDHYYRVVQRPEPSPPPPTPVEVAQASRAPRNLVVVASAGGGILAAGWTTLVLKELIEERPQLAREIRLLSTISGGSVGAAHYVAALEGTDTVAPDLFDTVYERSVKSSLGESAYGFALLDFWRLFFGGWLPFIRDWDRGLLQEDAWCRTASGGGRCAATRPLSELRRPILEGRIPAVIFGATVMETGRRVMLTPLGFEASPVHEQPGSLARRAPTLSEYLFGEDGGEADVSLWTAARLSATFAYVSPAASAEIADPESGAIERAGDQRGHHMLDGGYYENFGVTSALDWLSEVLEAQEAAIERGEPGLGFEKVLLVRLNAFRWKPPRGAEPKKGSISALLGPVLGLAAIRTGVAVTRNEIEVDRFISSWNERLGGEVVAEVEFRPAAGDGTEPLSWHLTEAQIERQREQWPADLCGEGSIERAWRKMAAHLGQEACPRIPAGAATPAPATPAG